MCIIIQRDPGFVIPRDKFDNCVLNNPDGWGLSVPDGKGMLSTIRSVDGETNGDEVYSLLHDEFKDDKVLLHLRYTTAGETNLRNAHPFPILEEAVDGVDLRMAHNGTIHKYKHPMTSDLSWESDTRNFVRTFVRPLFKRMVAGVGPSELLKDEFIIKLLDDQLTAASVLSFIDGFGNTLNVNGEGNGGKQEEGWYYSNVYSFNPKHRVPASQHTRSAGNYSTKGTDLTPYNGNYGSQSQYWEKGRYVGPKSQGAGTTSSGSPVTKQQEDTKVALFSTKFEVKDPFDLTLLSDETLLTLQEEAPADFMLLTKELLSIVYTQGQHNKKIEKENCGLLETIKKLKGESNERAA